MNPLIVRNDANLSIQWTHEAELLKQEALSLSGVVGRVSNAEENANAVSAVAEIARVLKLCEAAREACKKPVLDFGRAIDAKAKEFRAELEREQLRISKEIGNFQALEAAKVRAAEQAQREELSRIEREKAAAIAEAKSHDEVDAITERANQEAAAVLKYEAPKAGGQSVETVWVIDRINDWQLASYHPVFVRKIEFDLLAIKSALKSGMRITGVTAHQETVSKVRAAKEPGLMKLGAECS